MIIRLVRHGNILPLYNGRVGFRVHVRVPHSEKYAICSASLPFKTRPEPVFEVNEDRICPACLRRALGDSTSYGGAMKEEVKR